jgi:pimeloyl-ACP methyl ester carboxylesterase
MNEMTEQTVRGLPLPPDLETVRLDGARLAYVEQGSGQPVVFVHGSISDLTIWEPQLAPVGERYRAIAYSRRYAWPNEDLPSGANDVMQPHVDDLLAFLRAVDAYPAHLVGNSWGAFICLRAAMQEPAAARSLVLEEPPLVPLIVGAPPIPAQIVKSLLRHPLATVAVLRFAAGTVAPVAKLIKAGEVEASIPRFGRGVLGGQAFDALPEHVRAHMRANASTHVGQALADGGFEPITESQISAVLTPALVIAGANSPIMFRRLAGLLASLLPNSRTLNVPAASHAMHVENPTAVNDAVLRFLASVTEQQR